MCSAIPETELMTTVVAVTVYMFQAIGEHLRQRPELLPQTLSTLFEIVLFEDCSNQWSLSRPMLGLILLNEQIYHELKHRIIASQPVRAAVPLLTYRRCNHVSDMPYWAMATSLVKAMCLRTCCYKAASDVTLRRFIYCRIICRLRDRSIWQAAWTN